MDLGFLEKLNREVSEKFPLLGPIQDLKTDGSINRFDSIKLFDKAIWICVHEWFYKGNVYYKAIYGSWREGVQYTTTSYEKRQAQSKEFYEQEKAKIKETQEKLEKEKEEKHEACKAKWAPFYYSLNERLDVHDYLRNKNIDSNFHARIDEKNVLFIPAWNSQGVFVGGQRIFLDPETNKYEKRYTFGIEKTGSFCPFGDIKGARFIYIAEGFATAASIYMAFRDNPKIAVACVWDTSNLLTGAQAIRKVNPTSNIVFAADRDINLDFKWNNIGERKAIEASKKINNSIVRTVKFELSNDKWSDFNDLHQFEGLEKVVSQLSVDESNFIHIVPLGIEGDKFIYFSTQTKNILTFNASDHNQTKFILLAPEKYWGDRFGYLKNKEGQLTTRPNWTKVIEGMGTESRGVGHFNSSKIRGIGAWDEEGEIIVNVGDKLFYKGEYCPIYNNDLDLNYFYQAGNPINVDLSRPLGNSDMLKIVEAFQMLRYKNPNDFITVLGWLFSAQIFAALPWRPHIWFTGPGGAGKSTILGYIHSLIRNSIMIQDSTVAGIRQKIASDTMAIISDEAEPNSQRDRERLTDIISLARQSSTKSGYESLRGTAGGRSLSYNTNAIFCMGSIQLSKMGKADTSRFFIIEMNSVEGQPHSEFVRLENAMSEISGFTDGLFARAVGMYKNHITNIETAKQVIKEKKIESRQADQLAPIIAGYYAYFDTGIMPKDFVLRTIEEMNFEKSDYVQDNKTDDSERCLQAILEIYIQGEQKTIIQSINALRKPEINYRDEQLLGIYGIKFLKDEEKLFIPSESSLIKSNLEKMADISDYKNLLRRHKNFIKNDRISVNGQLKRGLTISLSTYFEQSF
jgi:phage/plasmid primase-like uncharacterized protein